MWSAIAFRVRRLRSAALRPSPPATRALLAAGLSILCPGGGHVYAGDRLRGIAALAIVAGIVLPAWIVAGIHLEGPTAGIVAVAAAWLGWGALPLAAALRAFRRRPPDGWAAAALATAFLFVGMGLLGAELSWIRSRLVSLFQTPTPSMVPALEPGDVFLVDVRAPAGRPPVPGEIVVFHPPDHRAPWYAKRVVATAGSVVSLRGSRLEVDGRSRALSSPSPGPGRHFEELGGQRYAVEDDRGGFSPDFGPVRVPAGHVFVLGDSRRRSRDSRAFGAVPLDAIHGRALRVVWSRDVWHSRSR